MRAFIIVFLLAATAGAGYWWSQAADAPAEASRRSWGGPVPVAVAPVAERPLSETIEALGTTVARESVTITANVTETVSRVAFDDGDYVTAGDVLVELTSAEESSQLREAQVAIEDAQRKLDRLRDLGSRSLVSASEVDDAQAVLESAEARLATVRARIGDRLIAAPFGGVLGFRAVSVGTLVSPGTTITTLDDIATVNVDFTIPETALGAIRTGAPLVAKSVAYSGDEFAGVVKSIGSRIDPITRSVLVRAEMPNDDQRLRPGMLLSLEIVVNERNGISVPARAIVQETVRAFVFVAQPDGTAERREVTLGARSENSVEIVDGLAVGDQLIVTGIVKLRPGSAITVRDSGASDAMNAGS
ncbi:MAG: efflux RND transporter periplasmic adaptor subunit [Pseudomonadota bacterium]